MSTVKWLIEKDVMHGEVESTQRLTDALKRQNIDHKVVEYVPYSGSTAYLASFLQEDCVVFHGSLQFGAQIRREAKWIPGVFHNPPKYSCTAYYPALGEYLLNENYIMLPYGELKRRTEYLYEHLGQDRAIFIRPNVGDKLFTGKLVYKENFDKDVEMLGFYDVPPEALVVVAEPSNLNAEWRFVVTENGVAAGSQYRKGVMVWRDVAYPQEALDLANEIVKKYKPDEAWVVDICLTKSGRYRLMEIGCFSCCGLYECNRDAVIAAVTAAALKEWESFQCGSS